MAVERGTGGGDPALVVDQVLDPTGTPASAPVSTTSLGPDRLTPFDRLVQEAGPIQQPDRYVEERKALSGEPMTSGGVDRAPALTPSPPRRRGG